MKIRGFIQHFLLLFTLRAGLVGSGKPPLDIQLSDFVITVITLGLGGPFVAGFLLAVFVWIIKRLWRSNTAKSKYERIN